MYAIYIVDKDDFLREPPSGVSRNYGEQEAILLFEYKDHAIRRSKVLCNSQSSFFIIEVEMPKVELHLNKRI